MDETKTVRIEGDRVLPFEPVGMDLDKCVDWLSERVDVPKETIREILLLEEEWIETFGAAIT